jgi:metal-responsive CopG/Arc/MetJ family transcriptional regulator
MKTAISIPDDLFADAERLAQALRKSRSRLYGDAVREYLARHSSERVTETLDALCSELGSAAQAGADAEVASGGGFAREAARRTLERSDW